MERLKVGSAKMGLQLGERELSLFQTCYEELVDWNQKMNLTAITDYEKVQINHFLDSLTVFSVWQPSPDNPNPKVIDIGTGAGMPGIPLKIVMPCIRLTLLDSTNKKIGFLNHLKEKLGLDDVEVVSGRAEEIARLSEYREQFDLVLARGLAAMPTLAELTLPFCAVGGKVILHKKLDIKAELNSAKKAVFTVGGKRAELKPVTLPEFTDSRCLVVINKVTRTPGKYPRRNGVPAKDPIL